MVDYKMLNKKIEESGLKREAIAKRLGLTSKSLRNKLSGQTSFRDFEIHLLKEILKLSNEEFLSIFFPQQLAETATLKIEEKE